MAGWFEVSQANDGQYRFVLKAGNGEPILNSELYKIKAAALNGIASVQKNSPDDGRYERVVAKNDKPYFNYGYPWGMVYFRVDTEVIIAYGVENDRQSPRSLLKKVNIEHTFHSQPKFKFKKYFMTS